MLSTSDLDGLVVWSLVRAARAAARHLERVLAPSGLTAQQFGVLAQLAVDGPLTQAALARAVLVRPQSAEALLGPLVERGLLVRSGERGRGRPNPYRLTGQGQELLAHVWGPVSATNELGFAGLDEQDASRMNEWLQQMLRAHPG